MSANPVSPQSKAVLDGRHALGAPPLWEQTAPEARAGFAPVREMIGAGPDITTVRDFVIPGSGGDISARVYEPAADSPGTVVYFHGGGWTIGSVTDWDACVRALASACGLTTVSVDYRLAPEHRFPAAADDCFDAYRWVAAELAGGRPVVVAGDSAGGNLATVTALRARDAGGLQPAFQVLIYPVTDCDLDRPSYHEYDGADLILNRRDMIWFWDQYAPDPAARANPYASPLRAGSLAGLPPAWILTDEHDPLRDEGFAYAARLRDAGVPVQHRHFGEQIHGFVTMVNVLADADAAMAEAGAAIRAAVGA